MKQIFFFLLAALGIAVNATAQTGTGSTVMTGTQTQMIGGQKVFVSTGTQGTPLIGWSQSGASAGVITQDTHFDNPAFTIQRTGSDGDSTTTPTAIILAGKETAWNQPVLKVGGCLALSGDNYLTYWGNGSLSIPNGIYDNTGSTLGQLSIDPVHRQLVGTDGVTAKITWSGASVRLPSQTLSNSDSAMTLALADGRYAILSAANTWSATQTFNANTVQIGSHNTAPGHSGVTPNANDLLIKSQADALYAAKGTTSGTSAGVLRVYYAQFGEGIQLTATSGKIAFYQPHSGNITWTCNSTYVTQVPAGAQYTGTTPSYIKLQAGVYTFNAAVWNDASYESNMAGRKASAWLKSGTVRYTKLFDVEQYYGAQGSIYEARSTMTIYVFPSGQLGDYTADSPLYLYCEQTAGAIYSPGWKACLEIFRVGDLAN
ncbi:MAG: hypothetical protein ACFUZC_03415 [Chthoniobacteraceae bacterium]